MKIVCCDQRVKVALNGNLENVKNLISFLCYSVWSWLNDHIFSGENSDSSFIVVGMIHNKNSNIWVMALNDRNS
jgi:hypothetical protein